MELYEYTVTLSVRLTGRIVAATLAEARDVAIMQARATGLASIVYEDCKLIPNLGQPVQS